MYKERPLVKPFIITTTNGYIVDEIRPFFFNGRNNDASILLHIVKTNKGNFTDFMKEQDILIVDRGFRYSFDFLKDCRFKVEILRFFQSQENNILQRWQMLHRWLPKYGGWSRQITRESRNRSTCISIRPYKKNVVFPLTL
jgi:hypothetical protein